jgi:ferric-dicitrate binding protein FerR (iron transport regulator)
MTHEPNDRSTDKAVTAAKPDAAELEHQIEDLRAELGALVQELDRRRHDAFDLRLQLRRHAGAIAIVGGSLALIVARRVWIVRRRRARVYYSRAIAAARVLSILAKETGAWRPTPS